MTAVAKNNPNVTHVYQDAKVNWKLYSVFKYEDFTLVRKNTGKIFKNY